MRDTHVTYLDTVGRPTITLSKKHLTEKHTGLVYVELTLTGYYFHVLTLYFRYRIVYPPPRI
jgi:hypothetical protein